MENKVGRTRSAVAARATGGGAHPSPSCLSGTKRLFNTSSRRPRFHSSCLCVQLWHSRASSLCCNAGFGDTTWHLFDVKRTVKAATDLLAACVCVCLCVCGFKSERWYHRAAFMNRCTEAQMTENPLTQANRPFSLLLCELMKDSCYFIICTLLATKQRRLWVQCQHSLKKKHPKFFSLNL